MEHFEWKMHDTVLVELKRKLWKQYVDNFYGCEEMFSGKTDRIFEYVLNKFETCGSIKFIYEEQDGKLPFLDLLLVWTDSSVLKLHIYTYGPVLEL